MGMERYADSPVGELVSTEIPIGERMVRHLAFVPSPLPDEMILSQTAWSMAVPRGRRAGPARGHDPRFAYGFVAADRADLAQRSVQHLGFGRDLRPCSRCARQRSHSLVAPHPAVTEPPWPPDSGYGCVAPHHSGSPKC